MKQGRKIAKPTTMVRVRQDSAQKLGERANREGKTVGQVVEEVLERDAQTPKTVEMGQEEKGAEKLPPAGVVKDEQMSYEVAGLVGGSTSLSESTIQAIADAVAERLKYVT